MLRKGLSDDYVIRPDFITLEEVMKDERFKRLRDTANGKIIIKELLNDYLEKKIKMLSNSREIKNDKFNNNIIKRVSLEHESKN